MDALEALPKSVNLSEELCAPVSFIYLFIIDKKKGTIYIQNCIS